jgi:hypothetical protein
MLTQGSSPGPVQTSSSNHTFGLSLGAGLCFLYGAYVWYASDQNSPSAKADIQEKDKEALTLKDRMRYFAQGVGYSLLTLGSYVAIYKCSLVAKEKLSESNGLNELNEWYDAEGWEKSGLNWDASLADIALAKKIRLLKSGANVSLAGGIFYLAFSKYQLPEAAVAKFKKALQK